MAKKPIALIIMDGYGINQNTEGNAIVAAKKSPYSLYNEEFATFSKDDVYNQSDAEGFINLFSLPLKIRAIQKQTVEGGAKEHESLERKVLKGIEFIQ